MSSLSMGRSPVAIIREPFIKPRRKIPQPLNGHVLDLALARHVEHETNAAHQLDVLRKCVVGCLSLRGIFVVFGLPGSVYDRLCFLSFLHTGWPNNQASVFGLNAF